MFRLHLGHRMLPRFEPSSVGSSHREQQQVKNLLDRNFSNLACGPEIQEKGVQHINFHFDKNTV